nr:hypothetical protein Iba_chr01aCG7930 [Ipomoea batatas]
MRELTSNMVYTFSVTYSVPLTRLLIDSNAQMAPSPFSLSPIDLPIDDRTFEAPSRVSSLAARLQFCEAPPGMKCPTPARHSLAIAGHSRTRVALLVPNFPDNESFFSNLCSLNRETGERTSHGDEESMEIWSSVPNID